MGPDTLVVITKSANSSQNLLPLWTGLLGGTLGVIGTLVASFTSRRTAKEQFAVQQTIAKSQLDAQTAAADRQIRATVVSANRMKWIDQLRAEVAAFIATILDVATDLASKSAIDRSITLPKFDKTNFHAANVELLVNNDEPDSCRLCELLQEAMDLVNGCMPDDADRTGLADSIEAKLFTIRDLTRTILKSEWERVKSLA